VRPAADALGRLLAEAMAELKFVAAGKTPLMVPVPLASGRERQRGFNQAEEMARAAMKHWSRRSAVVGETPALPGKTAQARTPVPHSRGGLEGIVAGETPALPGKIAQARTPVPHGPSGLDGIVAGETPALPGKIAQARTPVPHGRGGLEGIVAGETPGVPGNIAQARTPVPHGPVELNTTALGRTRETQSQTGLTRHQRRLNLRGAFVAARPEQIAGREIILVDDVYTTGTTAYECARVLRRAGAAEVYVATAARVLKGEVAAAEEFEVATKAEA
jgi:predicted amidophosphoribosyltransferase